MCAAELFSITETAGVRIHVASALYEVAHGVQTTETLRLVQDGGVQSPVAIVVVVDADRAYTGVTAQHQGTSCAISVRASRVVA